MRYTDFLHDSECNAGEMGNPYKYFINLCKPYVNFACLLSVLAMLLEKSAKIM